MEMEMEDGGDTCSKEEEPKLINPNTEDKKKAEIIVTPQLPKIKKPVIKFIDDEDQNLLKIKDSRQVRRKFLAEQLPEVRSIGRAIARRMAEQHKRNKFLWSKF